MAINRSDLAFRGSFLSIFFSLHILLSEKQVVGLYCSLDQPAALCNTQLRSRRKYPRAYGLT